MFVTVYGATREILKDFARNLKTSALVYPNGKGIFFVQIYTHSLYLQKKSADGVSAVNSNELAERLGKSAFYSAEIIGENILRSMSANKLTILSCPDLQ